MRCFITAYVNSELSIEAQDAFDQVAQDHYNQQQWDKIQANADEYNTHAANITCYELVPDDTPPAVGTIYMDYSREQNGEDFKFGGYWEVVHNETVQENNHTLCLLVRRDGQKFRAPQDCGGRENIDTMVNCHLERKDRNSLDMGFEAFYFLQRELYCNNVQGRCNDCPFANND